MLYVYRASAGSGKTHLLTGFYIKLLFRKDLASEEVGRAALFDEILAVTFTNKATAEMKTRIVEELELLSRTPVQSDYYAELNPGDKEPENAIRQKAEHILSRILNDYADFNISTIDSFFQKIVRSFARELDLQGSYEIELDASKVLEAAVTAFINNLDTQDDKVLFDWVLNFSRERISEGSGWDFKRDLLNMAAVLTTEEYRKYSDQIAEFTADKKALKEYADAMKRKVHDFRTALADTGAEGVTLLERYQLSPGDFSGRSNPMGHFRIWMNGEIKEPTKTFFAWAENPEKWFAKTSPLRGKLAAETQNDLMGLMQRAASLFGEDYKTYLSATAILKNIYQLGILANINKQARDYCAEQCTMLLSSTTELLNSLIGSDDAPFIYEKVGTRIRHFMIDEFQDTSGMQWRNFMPLLSNSLSQGNQNLIVGDVKQSIYRWRGSDWGLLHSGLQHYESAQRHDDSSTLRTNYRSKSEIIHFNNDFFRQAAETLEATFNENRSSENHDITQIYSDVTQQIPARKPQSGEGLLHIEFLEGKTVGDVKAAAMERLPELIIELQKNGFQPRDIAILGRSKDICTLSAETLLRYRKEHPDSPYGLDIISSEALLLSSRPVIQTLISLMQHLQNPKSSILQAIAASNYLQLGGCDMAEALHRFFDDPTIHPRLSEIANRPLYEMTEELIGILPPAGRREEAFLQAFRDIVLEFISNNSTDLTAFLEWWETSGIKKSIATPSEQNAIRIMTIHQSKGLGMPAVVIPYASWEMDINTNHDEILWCEPHGVGFERDKLVLPIKISKDLPRTIFNREYDLERLRSMIDNLNTAYVAFTRPKEALILLAPVPSDKAVTPLERLLADYAGQSDGTFSNGLWQRADDHRAADVSATTPLPPVDTAGTYHLRLPHLSLKRSQMLPDEEKIRRGNCIHEALASIIDSRHIDAPIERLYRQGILDATLIDENEMKTLIHALLVHTEVAPWFAEGNRVFNEQTILSRGDVTQRPDRIVMTPDGDLIVVDYKTGQEHPTYKKQVKSYMKLLSGMGFERISGYLWYVDPHHIERV